MFLSLKGIAVCCCFFCLDWLLHVGFPVCMSTAKASFKTCDHYNKHAKLMFCRTESLGMTLPRLNTKVLQSRYTMYSFGHMRKMINENDWRVSNSCPHANRCLSSLGIISKTVSVLWPYSHQQSDKSAVVHWAKLLRAHTYFWGNSDFKVSVVSFQNVKSWDKRRAIYYPYFSYKK